PAVARSQSGDRDARTGRRIRGRCRYRNRRMMLAKGGVNKTMLSEERDGATAVLIMDYPERRNALGVAMRQALLDALERIESDRDIRAVVITGAGGNFSSGGDISGMDAADLEAGRQRFRLTHRLVRLMIKSS